MYTIRLLKSFRRLRVWLLSCKQMQKSSTGDNNFVKWKGIPRLRGYTLYYFLELFCLFMIELFLSKSNFDDDFSAKIEVNE